MLIKPTFANNIIKSFLRDKIFCLSPNAGSEDFLFVLPFLLNKRRSSKISKIQVICQNEDIFKNQFKSILFDKTSNFKKYEKQNLENDKIKNDNRKNIFNDYITTKNQDNANTKNYVYNEINFSSNLHRLINNSNTDAEEGIYLLNLGIQFSKNIIEKNIENLRFLLLDENDNILEDSSFFQISFDQIKNRNLRINREIFYSEITQDFIENFKLDLSEDQNFIIYNFGSSLDVNVFSIINLQLNYLRKASTNKTFNNDNSSTFRSNTRDTEFASLIESITKDFILEEETFEIEVKVKLFYKESQNDYLLLTKNLILSKNNKFVLKCFNFKKISIVNKILDDLDLEVLSNFRNQKIECSMSFIKPETVLMEKIIVSEIKRNNSIIDFYHTDSNFKLENKVFFIGKSIYDLTNRNTLENIQFWISKFERRAVISVKISLEGIERVYKPEVVLINRETYENYINETNIIFKNNLVIEDPIFNIGLSEENKSILTFNSIVLNNLQSFNNSAINFGYIDANNQGNIKSFLENCIVKIQNRTIVQNTNNKTYKNNYFFFKELFENIEEDSDVSSIRKDNLEKFVFTDDNFHLNAVKVQNNFENNKIIKFFLNNDVDNAYKDIINLTSLNISNRLILKILPIPKIIVDYKGKGTDTLGNPINEIHHDDINLNTRKKISEEFVNYILSGNNNISSTTFTRFREIFLDNNLVSNPNNFGEIFDYLLNYNTRYSSFFEKKTQYNIQDILGLINVDEEISKLKIITESFEENLQQKYFNFDEENQEFFYSEFPFTVGFEDVEYFSNENTSNFKTLKIVNDGLNKDFKIDITSLIGIYDKDNLKNVLPKIRVSLHFLITNEDKIINNDIVSNTNFTIISLGGYDYLTYKESFMDSNSSHFSNFKNCINNSLININDDCNIIIDEFSDSLNINNQSFNIYKNLFEFAIQNNLFILEKIVLRTSVSFEIQNQQNKIENITGVFNKELNRINLIDQNIKINNLDNISSVIITA